MSQLTRNPKSPADKSQCRKPSSGKTCLPGSYGTTLIFGEKAVIVRLDRTIQYAAASRFILKRLWNTGSPERPSAICPG
jgi:hypothetical protein